MLNSNLVVVTRDVPILCVIDDASVNTEQGSSVSSLSLVKLFRFGRVRIAFL